MIDELNCCDDKMSVLFHKKLVFLDHPRTAGTSVQYCLGKLGGKTQKRHSMIYEKAPIIFSTVRNPYDLLVSWWLILMRRNHFDGDFLPFITSYQNYNFTRGGRLFYFVEASTDILRFETLQEDFSRVMEKAGLPQNKLHHRNATAHRKPYQEYYTSEIIQAVKDRFVLDLEFTGYEF